MAWKTGWSYAQRGTNFTYWEQTGFTYTFYNNLRGMACRLKYSNWYGMLPCEVASVKLYLRGQEHVLHQNGREGFLVTPDREIYSDILEAGIMPGQVTVEMEFASSRRPESGNTFRPGVAMIMQSFEVYCEDISATDICVAALFGDSITHWGNWTGPLIAGMYAKYSGNLSIFEVAVNGARLLNGSPADQMNGLGYSGITRFEHDVLGQKGISCCTFALGLNDLAITEEAGDVPLTFDTYVSCVMEIIRKAHEKNVRIIGLTICPRAIEGAYTEAKNVLRRQINRWIMEDAPFDDSIDVAALVANETDTGLKAEYDCGDGVHINEAAGERIAAAFTAEMFHNSTGAKPAPFPGSECEKRETGMSGEVALAPQTVCPEV